MRKYLGFVVLLLVVAAFHAWHPAGAHAAQHLPMLVASSFMLAEPLTYEQLKALAKPTNADQPENVIWEYFDQVNVTATFTNGNLFTGKNTGLLSNWPSSGQLSSENYFRIWDVSFWPGIDVATGVALSYPGFDLQQIISPNHGNAQWTLTINAKTYGPFLMSSASQRGGVTGFMTGTFTAPVQLGYANNGVFGLTFPIQNQIVIPPQTSITFAVQSNAPGAFQQTTIPLQCSMRGTLYRPVV